MTPRITPDFSVLSVQSDHYQATQGAVKEASHRETLSRQCRETPDAVRKATEFHQGGEGGPRLASTRPRIVPTAFHQLGTHSISSWITSIQYSQYKSEIKQEEDMNKGVGKTSLLSVVLIKSQTLQTSQPNLHGFFIPVQRALLMGAAGKDQILAPAWCSPEKARAEHPGPLLTSVQVSWVHLRGAELRQFPGRNGLQTMQHRANSRAWTAILRLVMAFETFSKAGAAR